MEATLETAEGGHYAALIGAINDLERLRRALNDIRAEWEGNQSDTQALRNIRSIIEQLYEEGY